MTGQLLLLDLGVYKGQPVSVVIFNMVIKTMVDTF